MSAADQLEQKFPGLLDGIKYVESRGNPNAVNLRSGAAGAYGLMPATAAHYGVDPHNPEQAREAAAQNMTEGLKWSGGDIDRALRYYQGGPNTKGWGSDNKAYPGLVLNGIQQRPRGSGTPQQPPQTSADPFEAAMTGPSRTANAPTKPAASASSDPFEAAMIGGNGDGNADNVPVPAHQEVGDSNGGDGSVVRPNGSGRVNGPVGGGGRSGSAGVGAGGPGVQPSERGPDLRGTQSPEAPQEGLISNIGEGAHDALVGSLRGFGSMTGTAATLIGKGLDYTGLTEGREANALKNSDDLQALLASRQYDPHGWGNLGGEVASALPLVELKALQAAPEAGALIKALAFGAQGGVAGGSMSGGHDMLWNTAVGAGTGAVVGPIGEKIFAPILAPVLSKAQTLAKALREAVGGGGATGADAEAAYQASMARGGPTFNRMPHDVRSGIASMVDGGKSAVDIAQAYPEWVNPKINADAIDWWVKHRAAGGKEPVSFGMTDAAPSGQAAPSNVKSYVDAYMRGEGRGTSAADLELQQFAANNGPEIEAEFQRRTAGGQGANPSSAPADANTATLANALKNAGAGRGIESVREMPQSVTDDIAAARAKGVPVEHAQREADVRYVGGEPTIGSTTRDPTAQRLEKVNANLDTPEGAALATRAAGNNAAVHDTVQKTIEGYGGVPAQGEVSQKVAQSLANASDAEYGKVSALYKQGDEEAAAMKGTADNETAQRQGAADAQAAAKAQATARQELDAAQAAYKAAKLEPGVDMEKVSNDLVFARDGLRQAMTDPPKAPSVSTRTGAGYIDITPLRDALDAPATKNATIDGLKTLANGTRGYIDALSNGTNRVSASEAESIRQAINDAYDIRGGSINSHVGRLKGILDQSMDAATDVPASYREGRAAYKAWATKYEDPEGVANIIRRDAKGNFLNEDNWRRADNGLIGTTNEQQFQQVTRRLLANRDVETLNRLKAELVHRPYDAAAKGAGDQNNHAVFSPSKWRDTINSIGMNKYRALFGKDEVAHLATIYRAAQNLHEPVPGVVNSSNSGTTMINAAGMADALRKVEDAGKPKGGNAALVRGIRALHIPAGALHVIPLVGGAGHMAIEGAAGAVARRGGQKAVSAANKELAAAIQRTLDPAVARDAANENARRVLTVKRRRDLANALGRHVAPAASVAVTGKASR